MHGSMLVVLEEFRQLCAPGRKEGGRGPLTAQTRPRTAVERNVGPSNLAQPLFPPPLGAELVRVRAVQVLAALQREAGEDHFLARHDRDRTVAAGAAAVRQRGRDPGTACVGVQRGIASQRCACVSDDGCYDGRGGRPTFVQDPLEVRDVPQLLLGRDLCECAESNGRLDRRAQLPEHVGVARETQRGPG